MLNEDNSRALNNCHQAAMELGRWPLSTRTRLDRRLRTARRRLDQSRLQSVQKVSYLTYTSDQICLLGSMNNTDTTAMLSSQLANF